MFLSLISIFPKSNMGLELGAILLIFTGQVWNMTFSFYSSLKGVPTDFKEAYTVMGLSNFASKSVEEVTATGAATLFQMYWTGEREVMVQRMQRAHAAGAQGLIATLDWSFSMGRDWGSPVIPDATAGTMAHRCG